MTTTMRTLVVLGAGTAGTMVVNKLRHRLPTTEWRITVVDKDDIHDYQPGYLFLPFGPHGISSDRATHEGWTASAHPDADLVHFACADGRVASMTCYYPLRLAWSGRTLFVSTAECELLMFENLLDVLEAAGLKTGLPQ